MAFCINCGEKLVERAKFCHMCGFPVGGSSVVSQHKQEYAGNVLKCPNCGAVVSPLDVTCLSCGMELHGKKASISVREFAQQIAQIEAQRTLITKQNKTRGLFSYYSDLLDMYRISDVAAQEIALIKSFPIPNTIEEITEFVLLADGSININLSKNTINNNLSRGAGAIKSDEQFISDAWVGKLEQSYHKAEIMFGREPLFERIKEIYSRKMKQLKIKV